MDPGKIKPWCTEKDLFLILDCWDNFEYFKINPKGKELTVQIPLPVRFVGIRLDKIEKALDIQELTIADKEIVKLRKQIVELPENSVVIQESATNLEKIKDDNYWTRLTHEKIEFLRNTIKPLFRTVSQTDFKAMRFKKDLLETSLAMLADEKEKFEALKDNITEIIGELPLSVNVVAMAFDVFIHNHSNLSSRQLEFLSLLKDFILEKESVKKRDLIESPFTIIHPRGIRGIFSPVEIREILNMTDRLAG